MQIKKSLMEISYGFTNHQAKNQLKQLDAFLQKLNLQQFLKQIVTVSKLRKLQSQYLQKIKKYENFAFTNINIFVLIIQTVNSILKSSHHLIIQCPKMRIFITSNEDGSFKRTRLFLDNCTNTSQLINKICKQIGARKNEIIIKLKHEPYQLIIIDGWTLTHYPIRNGSTFIVYFNFKQHSQQSRSSTNLLSKQDDEDLYQSFYENANKLSFLSNHAENDDSKYLQECLKKMHDAIRNGQIETISEILNEEPAVEEESQLQIQYQKKYEYLLNQLGQYGRNALHEAIQINSIDIVSYLIIKGADPNVMTVDQYTPLQLAVIYRAPEILSVLLQHKKVNINQVTVHGTALHIAISNQEIKCIQILFQNDVDCETQDYEGRKAIDLTSNIKLRQLLEIISEIKRVDVPNISKGYVCQAKLNVNSFRKLVLIVNPFKNEALIMNDNDELQDKIFLTHAKHAQEVGRNVIKHKGLAFFRLIIKNKQKQQVFFGVKNENILKQWIKVINTAIQFQNICKYVRPILSSEQLIQLLDDENNQISIFKRKTNMPQRFKTAFSILDFCSADQRLSIRKFDEDEKTKACNEDQILQRSQIILGSIIKYEEINSQQKKKKTYQNVSAISQAQNSSRNSSPQRILTTKKQSSSSKSQKIFSVKLRDFKIIKLIGNGSFGHVYLTKNLRNNKIYALKVLNKKKLMNKKQLKYAAGEVNILKSIEFPFIINLSFAFQTPMNLYLAMDNCPNGDLSQLIVVKQRLSEDVSKFVIAQIILAVEYLHMHSIIYRDLKPENILIASDGYIRLTDFGLSKQNCFSMSFCGSPAYLSPEMLEKKGVGFPNDIYGIGCVLYQMIVGEPPFFDEKLQILFENIKTMKLCYPRFISSEAKSFLGGLLERDINKRLGTNGFSQIKTHSFFDNFDWQLLISKKMNPPPQMFINNPDVSFYNDVDIQQLDEIRLNDKDYDESEDKTVKIRNFTFVKSGEYDNCEL